MDIETIRQKVREGDYLVRSQAVLHALKEGFERQDMVDAVLNGQIIESYPDDKRVLISGHTELGQNFRIYLHVVCEYANPMYIEFITAYIPDEKRWEKPDFRRRKRRRR
ncbi:MAG: DUF4258 domain-containing protein [Chloroflexota bacterium]